MNRELLRQLKSLLQLIIKELETEDKIKEIIEEPFSDSYNPWGQRGEKPASPYPPWTKPYPQWPNYSYDDLTSVEYGCIPTTTIYENYCNVYK